MNDVLPMNKCLVVLSGGQDSTTCLGVAMHQFAAVEAVMFNYGQKHIVELMCARVLCEKHNIPLTVYEIPALQQLGDSALIAGSSASVNDKHHSNSNLPASFVPNRNALFMTTAHALAQKIGAEFVMTGVCETDYSGYPDCRQAFIESLQLTLNLGYETEIEFLTPLMHLNKAQTFKLAETVGILDDVIHISHTCYEGDHSTFNAWGYGCGECPACKLRAKGYEEYSNDKDTPRA